MARLPSRAALLLGCLSLGPAACTAPSPPSPTTNEQPAAAALARWPEQGDCPFLLAWLARQLEEGTAPLSSEQAPIALLEQPGAAQGGRWVLDLPLPQASAENASPARCLLVLAPPQVVVSQRELGRRTLWSQRVRAVHRRLNPDYEAGRRALARLQERHEREERAHTRELRRLGASDDPLVSLASVLGGLVLGGLGALAREEELQQARSELAAVPRWVEEEEIESYEVPVVDIELLHHSTLKLALVDTQDGRFWSIAEPLEIRKVFSVAESVHPKDKRVSAGDAPFLTRAHFEERARAPLEIRLSAFLAPLATAAAREAGARGGVDELAKLWVEPALDPTPQVGSLEPAPAAPRLQPRAADAAALVRVEGQGGSAFGFYLGRHAVLTLRRVLGDSLLARVITPDQFVTWGVPIEDTPTHPELVLLHVPRAGPPLPLATSEPSVRPPLPPAGAPVLIDGRVAAVSLEPRSGRILPAAHLVPLLRLARGPLD